MNRNKDWTEEELTILKETYPKYGKYEVAKILDRTPVAVAVKANRLGIMRPHHKYDETYFDKIDSSDKAYWLGFIVADGYVVNDPKSRNYELGIELSSVDETHLSKFIMCINSDIKIKRRVRKNFENVGYDTESETSFIRIYSKHIVNSLSKYGIVQNKSYKLNKICVNKEFIWDYIRGYFDGDGSFSYTRVSNKNGITHTYGRIGFVCHQIQFLQDLKNILDGEKIISHINQDRNFWTLQIRHTPSVISFFNHIYNKECICLSRKYNKYKNFYS